MPGDHKKGNEVAKGKRVKKRSVQSVVPTIIVIVVAALVVACVAVGVVASASKDRVYHNVFISGVDVSGMTFNEVHNTLLNSEIPMASDISVEVVLTDDISVTFTGADAGYAENVSDVAKQAVELGKGGFFGSAVNYVKSFFKATELTVGGEFGEEAVRQRIKEAADKVDREGSGQGCVIGADSITVTKGLAAYIVDREAVFNYVKETLTKNTSGKFTTDEFSDKENSAVGVDLDVLYNSIYVAPKNAEYDLETGEKIPEVVGISFDLEAAKLQYAALNDGESMTIPFVYTLPDITVEKLDALMFKDRLAYRSTTLATSSANRINNVSLSADAINGLVLNPGDEFSFNGVVGERTADKGYKPAGAYVGGNTVDQIGGGICQTSSTLYYCTLMADLEVTNRTNHMYTVAYLPLGYDATVNWPNLDFKFKNNMDTPIKLIAYVQDKQLTVEIWGTAPEADGTRMVLDHDVVEVIARPEVYEEDPTLAPGETKVKVSGHDGYVVESYREIYKGDTLVSRTLIAKSKYRTQDKVILVAVGELPTPPGEEIPPEGGEVTPPEGGEVTPPEGGEVTPPEGGEVTPPEGGDVPVGGETTEPGTEPETGDTGGTDAPADGGATDSEPTGGDDPADPAE